MTKWIAALFIAGIVFCVAVPGNRVFGVTYLSTFDNSKTECPNVVVSTAGTRVTLDDGRTFDVPDVSPTDLAAKLAQGQNRVRIDPIDHSFNTLTPKAFCGFDFPQRSRLLTIPLIRQTTGRYTSVCVGEAR